jgi:hypothetical protein
LAWDALTTPHKFAAVTDARNLDGIARHPRRTMETDFLAGEVALAIRVAFDG